MSIWDPGAPAPPPHRSPRPADKCLACGHLRFTHDHRDCQPTPCPHTTACKVCACAGFDGWDTR